MCLLAIAYQTIPGRPVVIAANRDEFYDHGSRHSETEDALCVHGKEAGTRSSSIIQLNPGGQVAQYLYAPGPPCQTPYHKIQ